MFAFHRSCDTDCFQAIAVVWERLSLSKRETVNYVRERFDMNELNYVEAKIVPVSSLQVGLQL
jgi:hypothetical protein